MNLSGYLCFGSLAAIFLGLILHDFMLSTIGFMVLVFGMYIVVMDDD